MAEQFSAEWPAYLQAAFRLVDSTSSSDAARFARVRDGFMAALLEDARVSEYLGATKKIAADGQTTSMTPLIERALVLVRDELRVEWPWAAFELAQRAVRRAVSDLTGHAFKYRLRIEPLVPTIALADPRPHPGEPIEEAMGRILSFNQEARGALKAAAHSSRRGGRAPKGDGVHLQSWGCWRYEAKILKPPRSISNIARSLPRHKRHPDPLDCGCRNHVRDAIAEAGRILALSACTWETMEEIRHRAPIT